jgi:hypothetical protein
MTPFSVDWRAPAIVRASRYVREILAAAVHAVEARDRIIEGQRVRIAQIERAWKGGGT